MIERHDTSDDSSELQLPEAVRDDLRRLYSPRVVVPPEVDRAILAAARRRLVRQRRSRMVLRWAEVAAAAAAAIAVVVWLADPWRQPPGVHTRMAAVTAVAGPKDIDRNGRVDILDAFTLARHIEDAQDLRGEWDLNADGVVDAGDVDTVAMAAVSLKGGAS